MELKFFDHGCTPVWKLIVEIAKLYCDLAARSSYSVVASCGPEGKRDTDSKLKGRP
jgi:hypothetical protein